MTDYQTAYDTPRGTIHLTAAGDSAPMCDIDAELTDWSEPRPAIVALAFASNHALGLCPNCAEAIANA